MKIRMMRTSYRTILVVMAALAATPALAADQGKAGWQVCFTPGEDCTGVITGEIDAAHKTILVQAYSFTSAPIAKALVDAKKRGVKVDAVLDKSQKTERYSGADFLANSGIPVKIDSRHAIAHNKIIVIDGATVITGSFNFTKAAQNRNAENLLVLRDRALAERYTENWKAHAEHAEPYKGRGQ